MDLIFDICFQLVLPFEGWLKNCNDFQVRKGHSMITQKDIIDVLDKQLLEGMGVLLTEEEQLKCEESVCDLVYTVIADQNRIVSSFIYFVNTFFSRCHSCSYNRFPLKQRDYQQYMRLAIYYQPICSLDLIGMHFRSCFLVARYTS